MSGTAARKVPLALDYVVGDRLRLTAEGRIIDFLDQETTRPNTPEEHVRQHYARALHFDYGYPKDVLGLGAPIKIGSRSVAADIVVYDSPEAAQLRDQGRIQLIVETKAPDVKSGVDQLKSYIFATSAEGGPSLPTFSETE